MIKLFNKIRNFLTATAGTPVSAPEMVTKEFPAVQSVTETSEQEEKQEKKTWRWTDTVDVCIDAFVEISKSIGKLIGSALMWSIFLYVAGYFIPDLRYKLPSLYNLIDFYLFCINWWAEFLWDLLLKLSA